MLCRHRKSVFWHLHWHISSKSTNHRFTDSQPYLACTDSVWCTVRCWSNAFYTWHLLSDKFLRFAINFANNTIAVELYKCTSMQEIKIHGQAEYVNEQRTCFLVQLQAKNGSGSQDDRIALHSSDNSPNFQVQKHGQQPTTVQSRNATTSTKHRGTVGSWLFLLKFERHLR